MRGRILALPVLALLASTVVLSQSSPPPQAPAQQRPTFRTTTEYVEVDASVTDKAGRFVRDLRKEDFRVTEDGRPQQVASVQLVDIAKAPDASGTVRDWMSSAGRVDSRIITNRSGSNGGVYFIVLDDLHIAGSHTPLARAIAAGFVRQSLGPDDIAAVVLTSGQPRGQDFTQNRKALLAAIDRMVGTKLPTAIIAGAEVVPSLATGEAMHVPDSDRTARVAQARAYLETVERLATVAATIPGRRKAAILVSEGLDFDLNARGDDIGRELRDRMRDALAAANRANLSIYPIDPQAPIRRGDEAVDIKSGMDPEKVNLAALQDEQRIAQDGLRTAAAATGGTAFTSTDYARAFNAIRDDNSTYYLLAYSRSGSGSDGKFHEIEVTVNRPGLVVRARKGYVKDAVPPAAAHETPATSAPVEIEEALRDPRPAAGLLLAADAVTLAGSDATASTVLVIRVDARNLAVTEAETALDVVIVPVDATGTPQKGQRLQIHVGGTGPIRERVARDGLAVPARLALAPGRYQVRIGMRDAATGRIGTLRYDLELPDSRDATATLTALLAPQGGGRVPVIAPDGQLADVLTADQLAVALARANVPTPARVAPTAPAAARASRAASPSTAYTKLVGRYRSGEDGPITEIQSWKARDLDKDTSSARLPGDPSTRAVAALLHAEAAVRGTSREVVEPQVNAGRQVMKTLDEEGYDAAFRRTWYLAVSSYCLAAGYQDEGTAMLRDVPGDLARHPEVLLAVGSLHEAYGSAPIGNRFTPRGPIVRYERSVELEKAAENYRAALKVDSSLMEAHLRLGRVLQQMGRTAQAVPEYEIVRSRADDAFLLHLAALFLGQVHEAEGRLDKAIECYRAAIREVPDGETAYLALGHALVAKGQRAAGWEAIGDMFGKDRAQTPARDPWWVYVHGQVWQVERRLAAMREAVRR